MRIRKGRNAHFPAFTVVHGKVRIHIGPTCGGWDLKQGETIRFNRHGKFTATRIFKHAAYIDATFPRKGWNPKGPTLERFVIRKQMQVLVHKGEVVSTQLLPETWGHLERLHLPYEQRSRMDPNYAL